MKEILSIQAAGTSQAADQASSGVKEGVAAAAVEIIELTAPAGIAVSNARLGNCDD